MTEIVLDLFDGQELLDAEAGRNTVYQVLRDCTPAPVADVALGQFGQHLLVAYRSGTGCVLLQIREILVFRYGYPSQKVIRHHRLFDSGLNGLGVFLVGDSDVVTTSHLSWIGQAIPTSESWNSRHYAIAFVEGLLECVASSLWFTTTSETKTPAEMLRDAAVLLEHGVDLRRGRGNSPGRM